MATVTLTPLFQQLDDGSGNLLQGFQDTDILRRSGTQFNFRQDDASAYDGFRISISGTGFTYSNGVPTGGTISSVLILNATGQTVASLSGISTSANSKSLEEFYSRAFEAGSGSGAWSYLLSGNDVISGSSGSDGDWPAGRNLGDDTYNGRGGDDRFDWEEGSDRYNGGTGYDGLSFAEMPLFPDPAPLKGVTIDVSARTIVDPWGDTDRFAGVEDFEGSRFADRYAGGNSFWDRFAGVGGRDLIDGGANSFDADGSVSGDDNDMVIHWKDYWEGGRRGIVADLETSFSAGSIKGTVRDGFGNIDTVIDIEGVGGTRFADSFTGSRMDNWFEGGEGKDTYSGGAGSDWVYLNISFGPRATTGVTVDLGRSTGQIINDGFGNVETVRGIEGVRGTSVNDTLEGNALANLIEGGNGADKLTGRGGADVFIFRDRSVIGDGDRITDFSSTDKLAFEIDNFAGMTDTVRLVNGTNAGTTQGTFLFNKVDDTLTWDSNGSAAGGRTVVAILTGVDTLARSNFDLWS